MDIEFKTGQDIIGSDDRKIGRVTGEEDGCVLVETGHVFKSTHAMPKEFVHQIDGELRASIGKEIVAGSPEVSGEWSPPDVLRYYGVGGLYSEEHDDAALDNARVAYGLSPKT